MKPSYLKLCGEKITAMSLMARLLKMKKKYGGTITNEQDGNTL